MAPKISLLSPGIFENGASIKIDDVFAEDGGLLYVLPLAVHLNFCLWTSRVDHSGPVLFSELFCWILPSCFKVIGGAGGLGLVGGWVGGWPQRFPCHPLAF